MIKVQNLRIGDIVGTTSLSALSIGIKIRTWGWRKAFAQDRSSHIATVVSEHTLFYFMEMLAQGIHETDVNEYDHSAPRQHIAFVGRHRAFESEATQKTYNDFMLELHARGIKYGYEDLANFILEKIGIHLKDKQETLICSELPRAGFKYCGIPYPSAWDKDCSPADWQQWVDLSRVSV
jgi:hypothetical protein